MSFVLDCSVTLAWLLPDEISARADAWLDQLSTRGALVPPIWGLEVGNALLMAVRRKRLSRPGFDRAFERLGALPIEVDGAGPLSSILGIAAQSGLTSYDAAYLELAKRRGLPLATLDTKLSDACRKFGVMLG